MTPEIVIIKDPLKIKSKSGEVVLPKDTILFYGKNISEGFDVYEVYVNIEDKPLKRRKASKKWFVTPA